jgi:GNAT superfamily N-acetyltransferase
MKKYIYYKDKNIEPIEIIELYTSVGWGKTVDYEEKSIKLMIINTSAIIYSRDEQGLLIGLARVFSDFVITTYIAEIAVRPDYQNQGVGRLLMEKVNAEFKNTSIFFDSLPNAEGFSEKCGFRKQKNMSVFSKRST